VLVARGFAVCAPTIPKKQMSLEMLCHERRQNCLMPIDEFSEELGDGMGLGLPFVDCARASASESSYEATVYRLATAHPGVAVAGLLSPSAPIGGHTTACVSEPGRRSLVEDDRRARFLFLNCGANRSTFSDAAQTQHTIRWNKVRSMTNLASYRAGDRTRRSCELGSGFPNECDNFRGH